MNTENLILGGDLNFSLGFRESWGSSAQMDSITDFMRRMLEQHDLIDIPMHHPLPTWWNRRIGSAALARRLDRFLMKGPLANHLHHFKQWVGTGGISDHSHILMEILGPHPKPKAPFKFNHFWLQDPSFSKIVSDFWLAHPIDRESSLARGFVKNLTELKHIVIEWAKVKKAKDDEQLITVEENIRALTDENNLGFTTVENKTRLVELEQQKQNILKSREESIRLRSRAIWLKAGDENSRFFHNFANGRRMENTIWNLPLPDGGMADSFNKLSQLGTSHFKGIFKSPAGTNLAEIINVASHFPRFVNNEDLQALNDPVTMNELENTIKWFQKEKSPCPDGWTIEFYLAFFDIIGADILRVVEEIRTSGQLYHAINSTFIALIPKSDSPTSFADFRPISLCNVLYKIISKIIANRIRPILSQHIAPQQFAFLENRQIHEVIGTAQEAIHTIWTKHLKSILLKIDLSKAFDQVSWLYIKMILIHLGFPHQLITWIMACITTPTYSILINGAASHFFHSERGLRQGCPLSPLLFLLVMEALSRLIKSAKRDGTIRGLKISEECYLTHLLFVDDVLILLDGSIRDTTSFNNILRLFAHATGMEVNKDKSTITMVGTSVNESFIAKQAFPYTTQALDRGLKYLGYWLKPTHQKIADWVWLVSKVEKKITCWYFRYLSRAGRLTLIKSVLEATPVFWMALAWIPRNILVKIQRLCNRYLWAGNEEKCIFAWIGWQKIALPKRWGGWGLKDLASFAKALAAKMGWALLTSHSLWTDIAYHKYIWPLNTIEWARLPNWNRVGISSIWKALLLPLIRNNIVWRIRNGHSARLGIDPWSGCGGRHRLPQELVTYLNHRGIKAIAQIADHENSDIFHQAWITAAQLNLPQRWHITWKEYCSALTESHIRIVEGPDELIWQQAESGRYTPKEGYKQIIIDRKPEVLDRWWHHIWKLSASPRSKLFTWCVLRNRLPTGENLMRRSIHGPSRCVLCKSESESTEHLFMRCPITQQTWQNIKPFVHYLGDWNGVDLINTWIDWGNINVGTKAVNLPIIVNWIIWKTRNRMIFEDREAHWPLIEAGIITAFNELPDPLAPKLRRQTPPPVIHQGTLWAFFDGAANTQSCGGGIIFHISASHFYHIKLGLGEGTNNFAELITLRHLLHFALSHHCNSINIYGDSQIVTNWINRISSCHSHTLNVILDEVYMLQEAFNQINVSHIYREHNQDADRLSKEAALMENGLWEITEFLEQQERKYYHRPYIDPTYPTAGPNIT